MAHDDLRSKLHPLELALVGSDHFLNSLLVFLRATSISLAKPHDNPIHSLELSRRLRPGNNTSPSQRNTIYNNYSYYHLDLSLAGPGVVELRRFPVESDTALRKENKS